MEVDFRICELPGGLPRPFWVIETVAA